MPALDYIRILELSEIITDDEGSPEVSFAIEYSEDEEFASAKAGVITFRMADIIDTAGLGPEDIWKIAGGLVNEVFVREKDEDGLIGIYHILGLPLSQWLRANTPILNQ